MPFDQARWQLDIVAADKTMQAFTSVDRRMQALEKQQAQTNRLLSAGASAVTSALSAMAGAFSAATVASRIWAAGMKAADLGEQAAQIGLSTDLLQAYRLEAAQNGVKVEELDAAMMRLTRSMGEANGGSDEAIARFDKLGVKLLDNEGKLRSNADILPELARGLLQVGSETERNALLMDFFGRSGGRMVTMLQAWAGGNDELVESAKRAGAIVSGETSEAWDKLGDRLQVVNQQLDTFLATVGAPIVVSGMEHVLKVFESTRKEIEAIQKAWAWLTTSKTDLGGLYKQAADAEERIAALQRLPAGTGREAMLQQELEMLGEIRQQIAAMEMPETLAPVTVTASSGVRNPTGKAATKAGESLANRQFEESKKKLDELVQEFERIRKASEGVMDRFGDGTAYAARETAELNEMLALGYIGDGAYARALEEVNQRAAEMERSFRGAQGGIEGFAAGIQQGFADMAIANREFEYGKMAVDAISESLKILAGTSNKSFGEVALNFAAMVAQMELQAQASSVWRSLGGSSVVTDLFGGIGNLFSSGASSSPFNVGGDIIGGTYADGGRPPVGRLSLVGEEGPELWVPDRPGTILNQEQVAALGGGRTTIIVQQTVQVGEYVTSTEYRRGLDATRRAAMEGAQAALLSRRRAGDVRVKGVFG